VPKQRTEAIHSLRTALDQGTGRSAGQCRPILGYSEYRAYPARPAELVGSMVLQASTPAGTGITFHLELRNPAKS
jgi:hypothetical protein